MDDVVVGKKEVLVVIRLEEGQRRAVVLVDVVLVAVQHTWPKLGIVDSGDHTGQGIWLDNIVVVVKADIVADALLEAEVRVSGNTEVFRGLDDFNPWVSVGLEYLAHLIVVGRGVDDDKLPVAVGLIEHAVEHLL